MRYARKKLRLPGPSPSILLLLTTLATVGCAGVSPNDATTSDWPSYRGNPGGTGFSTLDEITTLNVGDLRLRWSYSLTASPSTAELASPGPNSQATPIVVDGVMYLPAADRVVALDPVAGQELWRFIVPDGRPSRRGVAYWPGDGATEPRVIFAAGARLFALDAATGVPASGFGTTGVVEIGIPYNSVPLVYDDVVVVGANTPPGAIGGIGNARAFNVRTGMMLWEFNSVPQPGEVGHDTWEGDSWEGRLGANAWPFYFTVDEARELLYLPLAAPIPFPYGGDRPGDNLFGNSVVAVDVRTGAYRWHFQTIHHDLWDHDPPAPPVLFDVEVDQAVVPALGVTTKSGYLYVLNRETGEPVFGVEERPVPQSDVPGERTSPTQPIPVAPVPMARVDYDPADLVTAEDTSLEHAEACAALVSSVGEIYNAGAFTPWVYRPEGAPPRTTLLFPGLVGGPNWGGVAFHPGLEYLYVFSQDLGALGWMEASADGHPVPYDRRGPRPTSFDVQVGDQRLPCQRPPWGQLTAVDGSTGEIAWRRPVGITAGLPAGRQGTGRPGRAGAIATAGGLVLIAATDDNRFRALDAATGETLWETVLPGRGNANPMTYRASDGRQYFVVVATDGVFAYGLP